MQQYKQQNYQFFLKADMQEHIGKWVAIAEGSIVTTGRNPKQVMGEAKKLAPNKRILLVRIPDKEMMIF